MRSGINESGISEERMFRTQVSASSFGIKFQQQREKEEIEVRERYRERKREKEAAEILVKYEEFSRVQNTTN